MILWRDFALLCANGLPMLGACLKSDCYTHLLNIHLNLVREVFEKRRVRSRKMALLGIAAQGNVTDFISRHFGLMEAASSL